MNIPIYPHSIPDLNRFSRLAHAVSPRFLEHESGEREELRLGRDDMESVSAQHRKWFLQSIGSSTEELFLLQQTHSNRVRILDNGDLNASEIGGWEGDALITRLTGKPIGVMTADCFPIILYDPEHHVAGVVHAGRRGTQNRILSTCIQAMVQAYGCRPESIFLGIGPGIGVCCYEVDADSIQPFREQYAEWERFASEQDDGKYFLDLFGANVQDARQAGILSRNIARLPECTACHIDRWYSFRKEGTTGRMITLAMLLP